jgi:F0F1-type ATP synthase membrane subunit b/b'
MARFILILIPLALIAFIFLYMNAKAKVSMFSNLMQEKDKRIYDLEREVKQLHKTIKKNFGDDY